MEAECADGVISVVANEIPALVRQMVAAALAGDFAKARPIHERILPLSRPRPVLPRARSAGSA